jgi:Fe-S-cluster containining protein
MKRKSSNRDIDENEAFLQWFSEEVPESLFCQIASQVLFRCQNCSECCKGEGYALVDDGDLQEIAKALGISKSEARARFTEPDPERNPGCRILKSTGPLNECCFLEAEARRCKIYSNRPRICRTFPMLNADPQADEAICFYSDCQGTHQFAKMVHEKSADPQVKKDIEELIEQPKRLLALRISLFVWLRRMLGRIEEADEICRITGVKESEDEGAFLRDCLAYFFMTMKTEGLEEYLEDGNANEGHT